MKIINGNDEFKEVVSNNIGGIIFCDAFKKNSIVDGNLQFSFDHDNANKLQLKIIELYEKKFHKDLLGSYTSDITKINVNSIFNHYNRCVKGEFYKDYRYFLPFLKYVLIHESYHNYQKNHNIDKETYSKSFEEIMIMLERVIRRFPIGTKKYNQEHDRFMSEISADRCGLYSGMTNYDFANENHNINKYFNYLKTRSDSYYALYDFDYFVETFKDIVDKANEIMKKNNLTRFKLHDYYFTNDLDDELLNNLLYIESIKETAFYRFLFDDDNNVNTLDELFSSIFVDCLDDRTLSYIFTSKVLNDTLNYEEIATEELEFILNEFENRLYEIDSLVSYNALKFNKGLNQLAIEKIEYYTSCIDKITNVINNRKTTINK